MKKFKLTAIFTLTLVTGWFFHSYIFYDHELQSIISRFSKIPGVTVIDSGGHEDVTFEDIHVTVEIAGKGKLRFEGIGENDSFSRDGSGTLVSQIGELKPKIIGCERSYEDGKQVGPFSRYDMELLDIGEQSDFAKELAGGIATIPEAINSYEELQSLISSWPVCPNSLIKVTDTGWYRHCASHMDSNSWPGIVSGEPDLGEACDPNNK